MTEPPGADLPRGLMLLIRLTTLTCCISLLNCDQRVTIGVVDSSLDSDDSSTESPDKPADANVDADTSLNPPIDGNNDANGSGISADADVDTDTSSNPPIDGNEDANVGANCVDSRPIVAGCDPTNEDNECPTAMASKCIVDFQAATPTGNCFFYTPMPGPFCLFTGVTDSCPAGYYCRNQTCRKLCLCDEECSTGQCCNEPIGGGFSLCSDC